MPMNTFQFPLVSSTQSILHYRFLHIHLHQHFLNLPKIKHKTQQKYSNQPTKNYPPNPRLRHRPAAAPPLPLRFLSIAARCSAASPLPNNLNYFRDRSVTSPPLRLRKLRIYAARNPPPARIHQCRGAAGPALPARPSPAACVLRRFRTDRLRPEDTADFSCAPAGARWTPGRKIKGSCKCGPRDYRLFIQESRRGLALSIIPLRGRRRAAARKGSVSSSLMSY